MGSLVADYGKQLSQTELATAFMAKELATEGKVREGFKQFLLNSGVPAEDLGTVMQQLEPEWKTIAANMITEFGDQYTAVVMEQVNAYEAIMQEATKRGFIDSMSRNLTLPGIVDAYARYHWFTCSAPTPLLLADSACIFENNGTRRFTAMDVKREDTQRIYLPIASETLLVGVKAPISPTIDWGLLNKATARCSYEFFISSRQLPADSHFIKGQGLWSGLFDKKDHQELLSDLTQELS